MHWEQVSNEASIIFLAFLTLISLQQHSNLYDGFSQKQRMVSFCDAHSYQISLHRRLLDRWSFLISSLVMTSGTVGVIVPPSCDAYVGAGGFDLLLGARLSEKDVLLYPVSMEG